MEPQAYATNEVLSMRAELIPVFQRALGLPSTATRRDIYEDLARRDMIRDVPSPRPVVPGFTYHYTERYQASLFATRGDTMPWVVITGKNLTELANSIMSALSKLRSYTVMAWLYEEETEDRERLYREILSGRFDGAPELLSAYYIEYRLFRGSGPIYKITPATVDAKLQIFETL